MGQGGPKYCGQRMKGLKRNRAVEGIDRPKRVSHFLPDPISRVPHPFAFCAKGWECPPTRTRQVGHPARAKCTRRNQCPHSRNHIEVADTEQ